MNKLVAIDIVSINGHEAKYALRHSESPPWRIEIDHPATQGEVYNGADLFEALKFARMHLETAGFRVLCSGARIDAHTSRMSSDAGGHILYLLTLGHPAKFDSLTYIFDRAELRQVGTVGEQMDFYAKWISSLAKII